MDATLLLIGCKRVGSSFIPLPCVEATSVERNRSPTRTLLKGLSFELSDHERIGVSLETEFLAAERRLRSNRQERTTSNTRVGLERAQR